MHNLLYRSRLLACFLALACWGCNSAPQDSDPPADDSAVVGDGQGKVTSDDTPADGQDEPEPEDPAPTTGDNNVNGHATAAGEQQFSNRLLKETSPYLLMHGHNPVDWYPWGPEAFAKAEEENKVIFLSIGYSSCHWCHVMEKESFLDEEIASFLNEHFVCIKVDREERPDVDNIYMRAMVAINGRGGWPMSVFMTPKAEPFFGGSYFPPRNDDRPGLPGFLPLVTRVQEVWASEPEKLVADAERLTEFVKADLDGRRPAALTPVDDAVLGLAVDSLAKEFDEEFGGFGYSFNEPMRPKFPSPSNLDLLIYRLQHADEESRQQSPEWKMLITTLDRMAMGGIRDHLGGGFHRYSVDRFWYIPHFEKMLYDNGQLASVYSEAYRLSGDNEYRRVVEEMLEWVLREMTDELGGFYSAMDADSEGEEGKFYRWDREQLEELLEAQQYSLFARVYGINLDANFEEDFHVPVMHETRAELAEQLNIDADQLREQSWTICQQLEKVRDARIKPFTDDKILTSWNGLMIRGFADAGRLLEEPRYIEVASKAADFVLAKLSTKEGRLLRTYRHGEAKLNAYLIDYAYFVDGLIALHKASGEQRWLDEAVRLTDDQIRYYLDKQNGGFFFTSDDHESLLARGKNPMDGAQPSGNAVAAQNLAYLFSATGNKEYLVQIERSVRSVSGILQAAPSASPRMVIAVAEMLKAQAATAEDE
jgi:uncharacterized protein YyaL (SSP411 family)